MGIYCIYTLTMRYIIILFIVLLHLPISGQQSDYLERKSQIERSTRQIYTVAEFRHIANSLQLTIDEFCDYPVIFPIWKPKRISSGFGMRRHPIYGGQNFHTGVDFPEPMGTAVYATGNGVVVRKGYDSGYGYFVEIEHSGGFRSFYAHLSRIWVNVGDSVSITQQIAAVGNTGVSTGSHLHFEIRKGNRFLNPIGWCYCLVEVMNKL